MKLQLIYMLINVLKSPEAAEFSISLFSLFSLSELIKLKKSETEWILTFIYLLLF